MPKARTKNSWLQCSAKRSLATKGKREYWITKLTPLEEETYALRKRLNSLDIKCSPGVVGIPEHDKSEIIKEINKDLIKIAYRWEEQGGSSSCRIDPDSLTTSDPTWTSKSTWLGRMTESLITRNWHENNLAFHVVVTKEPGLPNMYLVATILVQTMSTECSKLNLCGVCSWGCNSTACN